jgi:hypothetical protein
MTGEELSTILEPCGFARQAGGIFENLSTAFIRPANDGWLIGAHASWQQPVHVDLGLMRNAAEATIGTQHRFVSTAALSRDVRTVLAELEALTLQPDLLKCPDCGRWVVLKEPTRGQSFPPFLSCEGMRIVGRGPNKQPQCRGTSKRIAALWLHQ